MYLQGCKSPTHYMLTQLPLANTIDDFWQMIDLEKCDSIVMLDRLSNKNCEVTRIPVYLTHFTSLEILLHAELNSCNSWQQL